MREYNKSIENQFKLKETFIMQQDKQQKEFINFFSNMMDTFNKQKERVITFEYAFEQFLEFSKTKCREQTIAFYSRMIKPVLQFFYKNNVVYTNEVTKVVLNNFIIYQKNQKHNNTTINHYIDLIKMTMRFCYDNEIIDSNPIGNFKKLPKEIVDIKIIEQKNMSRILRYLDNLDLTNVFNLRNKLLIYVLAETGVRLNELLHIKTKNVIIKENTIFLDFTKTKYSRKVFIGDTTKFLAIRYMQLVKPKEYFFVNLNNGEQITKRVVYKILETLKKKLNIEQSISPHKWRHTLATNLLDKVSIEQIRKLLGHTELTTTQKYLHVKDEKTKKDLLEVLNCSYL